MPEIKIGDIVINTESGVVGEVIKQYFPTACAQQTMVKTLDGRKYHAPTSTWKHYEYSNIAAPCTVPVTMDAAAPMIVKHDYRDIKVAEGMTITVDVEDLKKEITRELYKDLDVFRGLHYGA